MTVTSLASRSALRSWLESGKDHLIHPSEQLLILEARVSQISDSYQVICDMHGIEASKFMTLWSSLLDLNPLKLLTLSKLVIQLTLQGYSADAISERIQHPKSRVKTVRFNLCLKRDKMACLIEEVIRDMKETSVEAVTQLYGIPEADVRFLKERYETSRSERLEGSVAWLFQRGVGMSDIEVILG